MVTLTPFHFSCKRVMSLCINLTILVRICHCVELKRKLSVDDRVATNT